MVSFGKNKDDKMAEKSRYRSEQDTAAAEEIADVLLTEKDDSPVVDPDVGSVAEDFDEFEDEEKMLGAEAETKLENESSESASLNEQVKKLCYEYEAINQQLEKSLVASHDLTKQLENSKKAGSSGYIALGIAVLACLLAVGAIVTNINMQRDVDDLREVLATEQAKILTLKQEAATKDKVIAEQMVLLNEKVEKIFASNNLESVLQVTQELKKQVSALANKNLAAMTRHSQMESHPTSESKVSLPSLKVETPAKFVIEKAVSPPQATEKGTSATAKPDAEKKPQNLELSGVDEKEAAPVKQKKHRWRKALSAKIKSLRKTENTEKPTKPTPPTLPTLD